MERRCISIKMNLDQLTVGYTIWNKEDLMPEIIGGLAENISPTSEVVLLFDNCTDDSFNKAFEEAKKHNLNIIALNYTDGDLFEVKANNELLRWFMKESKNDVIALFQDDIILKDKHFMSKIRSVLVNEPDAGLLGGRSGFELESLEFPEKPVNKVSNWEHKEEQYGERLKERGNTFAARTFLNRGPLVFTRRLIKEVGYLSEKYFPQWGDDLDYCAKCHFSHGLNNIVFQCDVESKVEWGAMRKKNTPLKKYGKFAQSHWGLFVSTWQEKIQHENSTKQ